MNLHIARGDQKLGPYSLAEAQGLLNAGTLRATDLAWHKGLTGWVPLSQVPGILATGSAQRPVWVWIICGYRFFMSGLALYGMLMLPLLHSSALAASASSPGIGGAYIQLLRNGTYDLAILLILLGLISTVLLFLLRRSSFYLLAVTFVLGLLSLGYSFTTGHANMLFNPWMLARLLVTWTLNAAILAYVWHLFRKGVLR